MQRKHQVERKCLYDSPYTATDESCKSVAIKLMLDKQRLRRGGVQLPGTSQARTGAGVRSDAQVRCCAKALLHTSILFNDHRTGFFNSAGRCSCQQLVFAGFHYPFCSFGIIISQVFCRYLKFHFNGASFFYHNFFKRF